MRGALSRLQSAARPGAWTVRRLCCSPRLQYDQPCCMLSYKSCVRRSAGVRVNASVRGRHSGLIVGEKWHGDKELEQLSEQALAQREDVLDGANRAISDGWRAVNDANRAVNAAAQDARSAKTEEERSKACQREHNAREHREKAEQALEQAKQEWKEANRAYEKAMWAYDIDKKSAQDLFSKQRDQAIAFRDCIPSESTLQQARALASMIKKGEDDFQSLEYQREALQLPGLEKPLPYGSSEELTMQPALQFVQRVGSGIDEFSHAVEGLADSHNPEQRRVLVVAQASGSGKTKLVHDVALEKGVAPVIVTVVEPKHGDLTAPFQHLALSEEKLRDAEVLRDVHDETVRLEVFRGHLFAVVLATHMEWAAHVAKELHKLGSRQRSKGDANRAILEATSNEVGQRGVASIVQDRLEGIAHIRKVNPWALLGEWTKQYVNSAAKKLKVALLALRGEPAGIPSPPILVTIDEAPRLMEHSMDRYSLRTNIKSSWMLGAAHALVVMTDQGIATCMTGSFFGVARLLDDSFDPLRARTRRFYHKVNITSADLWHNVLRRHVPTLPESIPPSIQGDLERLEGRPIFLLDQLLAQVLRDLANPDCRIDESRWPEDVRSVVDPSARRLAGYLYSRLPSAWERSVATMAERIETFTVPSFYYYPPEFLIRLLFSVFMQSGRLPVERFGRFGNWDLTEDDEVMKDAIKQGVLVYDPTREGSVLQEPVTLEAVRVLGRKHALLQPAMKDQLLCDVSNTIGLGYGHNCVMLARAFAWMLLRACDGKSGGVSLQKALAEVTPSGFAIPKSVSGKMVSITGARFVPMVDDSSTMDDWRAMSGSSTVWHRFSDSAGMGLMLRTTDGTVIGVQAKSGAACLAESVASCSLGWQYMSKRQTPGQPYVFAEERSAKRRQFLDHAPIAAGEEHLRLVFSVKGFSQRAVDAANAYNELCPQSAILLCESSEAALGPVHYSLSNLTDDTTIDFNRKSAASLLVHQDVGWEIGLRGGGQSFAQWLEEEEKGRQ